MVILDVQLCILVQGEKDLPPFYLLHFSHASKLDQEKVLELYVPFSCSPLFLHSRLNSMNRNSLWAQTLKLLYMKIISLPVSCISNRFIYSPHLQRVMQLDFVVLLMSWNYGVIRVPHSTMLWVDSFNEMISTSMERGNGNEMSFISNGTKE